MKIRDVPKKLPVFNGYTIDFRLKEFRKLDLNKGTIEFITFESKKGKALLKNYCENKTN